MAEYIDRDVAIAEINAVKFFVSTTEQKNIIKKVLESVNCIHAADVAPIVHGRWINQKGKFICDKCGNFARWTSSGGWWEMDATEYCPSCGAKMDKEEK